MNRRRFGLKAKEHRNGLTQSHKVAKKTSNLFVIRKMPLIFRALNLG